MPWVPVVRAGVSEQCSLTTVFHRAHEIRGLDRANPLVEVSVFRLLLALAIEALGPPDLGEWQALWQRGQFDPVQFDRHASEVEHRFRLFDDNAPFEQTKDLQTPSGKVGSTLLLFPEAASGNNVPLFGSMTEEAAPPVPLAEAARRLVALHGFDTAGLKSGAVGDPQMSAGKTAGNPTGPLGAIGLIIPQGRNLFESLMLNLPPAPTPGDSTAWAESPTTAAWTTRPSRGVLDVLTWQSRRVRLIPDDAARPSAVVGVIVAGGDRMEAVNPSHEPHTAWRTASATGGMSQLPVRHQPGRAAWRGLDAMVARDSSRVNELMKDVSKRQPTSRPLALDWVGRRRSSGSIAAGYPLDLRTVGVSYGNQRAVIDHTMSDSIPLPILALESTDTGQKIEEALVELVARAEVIRVAINDLANNLLISRGGTAQPWDKGEHPGDQFIGLVDAPTRQFLQVCRDQPDQLPTERAVWEKEARNAAWEIADPLIRQIPPSAFQGRIKNNRDTTKAGTEMNPARAELFFRGKLARTLPRANKLPRGEALT